MRINDAATPWHEDDLKAARQAGVTAILLPKAESLAQARRAAQTGLPVIPIIETARGVLNLAEVAATPGAAGFGSLDYALDLGLSPDSPGAGIVLDHARIQVLLQTRAAGLPPALDGVSRRAGHRRSGAQRPGRSRWALAACSASIRPRCR